MKDIGIIVARDRYGVIGNNNQMPGWNLPTDRKFFKRITTGNPVILGRKNYESLPPSWRPLPERTNIVMTENPIWDPQYDDVMVVHDLWTALHKAEKAPGEKIWIIGGEQIYRLALLRLTIKEIYITEVQGTFEGNIKFPSFNIDLYEIQRMQDVTKTEKDSNDFYIDHYLLKAA